MSENVITALITGLTIMIPILTAQWFKYRHDEREYQRSLAADNEANKKLEHITVLTNSTLTAANQRIDYLERELRHLKDILNNSQKE